MGSGTSPIGVTKKWLSAMTITYLRYALIFFITGTWSMRVSDCVLTKRDSAFHMFLALVAIAEIAWRGVSWVPKKEEFDWVFGRWFKTLCAICAFITFFDTPYIVDITLIFTANIVCACCAAYFTPKALARDVAVAIDKILAD